MASAPVNKNVSHEMLPKGIFIESKNDKLCEEFNLLFELLNYRAELVNFHVKLKESKKF